jgi:hypothetical protein
VGGRAISRKKKPRTGRKPRRGGTQLGGVCIPSPDPTEHLSLNLFELV